MKGKNEGTEIAVRHTREHIAMPPNTYPYYVLLPLSYAGKFTELSPAEMRKVARTLQIKLKKEDYEGENLRITEVLQITRVARGASLEEVAGNVLEWAEKNHSHAVGRVRTEMDEFFA